jgi:hypothetical protein
MNAQQQTRVDSYLMTLRRSLGALPAEDVNDILREIRGHILERAEAAGELTNERLVQILKELGRPEDIGPLYQAEAMMARARSSSSPKLIFLTTLHWAMRSVVGVVVFLGGINGYILALALFLAALTKPFMGDRVRVAWGAPATHEIPGWLIIPLGLVLGPLLLIGITRLLRWALRFMATPPVPRAARATEPVPAETRVSSGS